MDFLPTLPVFSAFFIAVLVLTITPGPDMIFFLSKSISQSRHAGFVAMIGASVGIIIHTLMVAVGLSALLAASATAFAVLKIAGALYLLWLAIDSLRGSSNFNVDKSNTQADKLKTIFLKALGINLLNPKIIVFFVTFLPQFVSTNDPNAFGKLIFLGLMFPIISIPVLTPIIIYAEKIAVTMRGSPTISRAIDYIFATVLGGFALKLFLTDAR